MVAVVVFEAVQNHISEKYGNRKHDVIYAHYLERPIDAVDSRPRLNGFMLVGELVHSGVERILGAAPEKCRTVRVRVERPVEAARRFIRADSGGDYVVLCGTADALVDGRPVEVKTTRNARRAPPWYWVLRARVYGFLYGAPPVLVVLDVVSGRERVFELEPLAREEVEEIVSRWLEAEWPRRTLPRLLD